LEDAQKGKPKLGEAEGLMVNVGAKNGGTGGGIIWRENFGGDEKNC
jgi:hypothetical protein